MRMEGRPDSELSTILDMYAGVDGWHIKENNLRGIASRIQIGTDWKTFTIRMMRDSGACTEYEKRKFAINSDKGWLYPQITIQAYSQTKEGPILSCGISRTVDIIQFIDNKLHKSRRTSNALFAVCSWAEMIAAGYNVKVLCPIKQNQHCFEMQ